MDSNYYRTLYEIAREVNSSLSVDRVLKSVMESTTRALNVKGCSVMLFSADRSRLIHAVAHGLSDWYINKGPVTADVVISTTLRGQPVQILDVSHDIRLQYRDQAVKEGITSILTVPIQLEKDTIGVIAVYSATRREFSPEEIEFLKAVANLGAVAIDRARAHDRLSDEYATAVTSLENRRREIARLEEIRNDLMRFISTAAHDLQAPLAAVQSYIHLLLDEYAGPLTEKQKHIMQRCNQRITRLLELIGDLLDITRIELDPTSNELKAVSPDQVLEAPLEDCIAAAQQKRIVVEVRVPSDLPSVLVSPKRMQQVFANLLSNAVKFTPEGGRILISAQPSKDNIIFTISDTGIGIPRNDLPRVFEEFFRASNVRMPDGSDSPPSGTGLGLAIVRRILEKHGGKIWVESPDPATGCGTRFTFSIPICQTSKPPENTGSQFSGET